MIHVQNLSKKYGDLTAIQNVSFRLEKGDVLGFLGPNGAGKTTTMRIITGYMPPNKGSVLIDDLDIFESPIEAKARIGYLPENPPLYNDMTVTDYLDFVADIKRVKGKDKSRKISDILEKCAIYDVRKRIIGHLSKGYRQRVGIAQALINDPSVVVLDEPTNGLDPRQIIEIRELIKNLAENHTVIISTHILSEVTMICSKVVIINHGNVVLEEPLESLSEKSEGAGRLFVRTAYTGPEVGEALSSVGNVMRVNYGGNPGEFIVEPIRGRDVTDEIVETVVRNGWRLQELSPLRHSLEDIFLKVISSEQN